MPTLTTTNDRKTGGLLRRVAGRVVAYAAASVVVGLTLPTIPLPLPLDALMAPAPVVVTRIPMQAAT
jgi:hypothetical protein